MTPVERILLKRPPFTELWGLDLPWPERGWWPAGWIAPDGGVTPPVTVVYRCRVTLPEAGTLRLHLAADAVYRWWIDGVPAGAGPEQGDRLHTWFDSYDWRAVAGEHTIVAMVTSFGDTGPYARMETRHGWLCAAENCPPELLNTGYARWEARTLAGITWTKPPFDSIGGEMRLDASSIPADFERGGGDGWEAAVMWSRGVDAGIGNELPPVPRLLPATLPPQLEKTIDGTLVVFAATEFSGARIDEADNDPALAARWQGVLLGQSCVLPPRSRLRLLLVLNDYYCANYRLVVQGGRDGEIRMGWAEGVKTEDRLHAPKGIRTQWRNRWFHGFFDTLLPDGREEMAFESILYRAGRFVLLDLVTAEEALTVRRLSFREERYPVEFSASLRFEEPQFEWLAHCCRRTLEMCSHDSFMDCPYYERLQYLGDTRIQAALTLVVGRDARLVLKALRMFHAGRIESGFFPSRYPSRVQQVIPTFTPYWVGMMLDYAMWRGIEPLRSMIPAARAAADAFELCRNSDGLVQLNRSWNFVDWSGWLRGVPPQGEYGVSAVVNALYVYLLDQLAQLCDCAGEGGFAALYRQRKHELAVRMVEVFWRSEKACFADTAEAVDGCEHTQILMLLAGELPPELVLPLAERLVRDDYERKATVYFSFYRYEAFRRLGRGDLLRQALERDFLSMADLGLMTLLEEPEPSRSDCHAWSAHPLWHFYTTLLGVRPASPGFRSVEVRPLPSVCRNLSGRVPHPDGGWIEVVLSAEGAEVTLPPDLSGRFVAPDGAVVLLRPGRNRIACKNL